ncbi:hypothetical protein G9A89_019639 [Geosiphon pyriformis]|nr:hypothetical protein G9A89_019639 [Geosiphon pyriformis]
MNENTKGIIAILTFSTISNIAVTIMLIWIATHSSSNKTVGRLVLNLLASDWLQSLGFMMSYTWLIKGGIQQNKYCEIQGILIQIGDVASGFWATCICLHTYTMVVHSHEPKWYLELSMAFIWPCNILLALSGYLFQKPKKPFYASADGAWCWISPNYPDHRIVLHYGIILILATVMILLYAMMFMIIYKRQGTIRMETTKRILQKTGRKMIYYPVGYVILVLPLALQRFLALRNQQLPFSYLIFAGCIFTSAGILNSIIYGITRNIVSVRPILGFVPKIKHHRTIISMSERRSSISGKNHRQMSLNMNIHTFTEARSSLSSEESTSIHAGSATLVPSQRVSFLEPGNDSPTIVKTDEAA